MRSNTILIVVGKGTRRAWEAIRDLPLYSFLLALLPLVNLYLANANVLPVVALGEPTAIVCALVLILLIVAYALTRTIAKAGLLAAAVAMSVMGYGSALAVAKDLGAIGPHALGTRWFLALWVGAALTASIAILRLRTVPNRLTQYLNATALVLIAAAIAQNGNRLRQGVLQVEQPYSSVQPTQGRTAFEGDTSPEPPDVYYIILDGYGREDVLNQYYSLDNRPFLSLLEQRGFYIADHARSNYPETALSLASSLNMDYLDALGVLDKAPGERSLALRTLVRDNYVASVFRDLGYTTVAVESGFSFFTSDMNLADIRIPFAGMDEFSWRIWDDTLATELMPTLVQLTRWRGVTSMFGAIASVAHLEEPTYTLAHIPAPHPPFVFRSDGSFTETRGYEGVAGNQWLPEESYREQVLFLNMRVLDMVDRILDTAGPSPIIVLQGDHGPMSNWMKTRETTPILLAIRFPGSAGGNLYREITPVNVFRMILDGYFGTHLGLLDDRSYWANYIFKTEKMCISDGIFPDLAEPSAWQRDASSALRASNGRVLMDSCDLEKFLLPKDGFFDLERYDGTYFRWAGPHINLRLPVYSEGPYVFRAGVNNAASPDEYQRILLRANGRVLGEKSIPPGQSDYTFSIVDNDAAGFGFLDVSIEHSGSDGDIDPRALALQYAWIDWFPLTGSPLLTSTQAGLPGLPLINLTESLRGSVGLGPSISSAWPIETQDGKPFLWLGYGHAHGLSATIWSVDNRQLRLAASVVPGPAREDSLRRVELVVENGTGRISYNAETSEDGLLQIEFDVAPGLNRFSIGVLTEPILWGQPNGDTRPLLLQFLGGHISPRP